MARRSKHKERESGGRSRVCAPSLTHKWEKILAVGCSHGYLADPAAISAVLQFRDLWKPKICIHLGDFTDTTAFRAGAKGTSDESVEVKPDLDLGLDFLKRFRPTLVFCGNHEARPWRLVNHYNAIVADCSRTFIKKVKRTCRKLRADLVPYEGWWNFRKIGGYTYVHGTIYGEQATKEYAESYGNCVHAHTHRACVAKGRRIDNPTAYGVGTLSNVPCMDYANTRRSTLSWSGGFVWGEYCEQQSVLWLHEQPRGTPWRLPLV